MPSIHLSHFSPVMYSFKQKHSPVWLLQVLFAEPCGLQLHSKINFRISQIFRCLPIICPFSYHNMKYIKRNCNFEFLPWHSVGLTEERPKYPALQWSHFSPSTLHLQVHCPQSSHEVEFSEPNSLQPHPNSGISVVKFPLSEKDDNSNKALIVYADYQNYRL